MRVRWLGWAGVEVEEQGERVVIDPLEDPAAVFAWLGEKAAAVPVPEIVPPAPGAVAALLTHLHRDHADAAALTAALQRDGAVHEPHDYGGATSDRLAIAEADHELTAAGLTRRPVAPWASVTAGPFTLTALPAVDGTGDPQVSWLVEAGAQRVLHLGDTMFHGWWWRITERFGAPDAVLAPINGARLSFPTADRRVPFRLSWIPNKRHSPLTFSELNSSCRSTTAPMNSPASTNRSPTPWSSCRRPAAG